MKNSITESGRVSTPATNQQLSDLFFAYNTTDITTTTAPHTKKSLNEIISIIKNGTDKTSDYEWISQTVISGLEQGIDVREIKKTIKPVKNNLPYFLFSGFQQQGHSNLEIQYNGCVQIDIDCKIPGGHLIAKQILELLKASPYVIFAGLSPSGVGVKGLILTNNTDKEKHLDVSKQITRHLSEKLDIDYKYFDNVSVSQPAFAFYDTDLYVNENPHIFEFDESLVVPETKSKKEKKAYRNSFTKVTENYNHTEKQIKYFCEIAKRASYDGNEKFGTIATTKYAGMCNQFGINLADAHSYMKSLYPSVKDAKRYNTLVDVYTRYESQFGMNIELNNEKQAKKNALEQQKTNSATIIPKGKYLYDMGIDLSENTQIESFTGSGKTYWVSRGVNEKRILVCRTAGLVEQIEKQYGAKPFYQYAKEVSNDDDFIVTTYNSLPKLVTKINSDEYTLFIDEVQNFTISASKGFLLDVLNRVIEVIPDFKKFHTLTATPAINLHPIFKDLKIQRFRQEEEKTKTFSFVTCENRNATTKQICLKNKDNNQQTVIYLNNTKEEGALGSLYSLLVDAGLKVAAIDASKKTSKEYIEIVVNGDLSNYDVLISTTVLKEGNSITKHSPNMTVICYTYFHAQEIEQASARFRNCDKLNVILYKSKDYEDSFSYFDIDEAKEILLRRAEASLAYNEIYNKTLLPSDILREKNTLDGRYCMMQGKKIVLDYLSISYALFQEETIAQNNNKSLMINDLKKYGFNASNEFNVNLEITKQEKEQAKEYTTSKKELKAFEMERILTEIQLGDKDSLTVNLEDTKLSKMERDLMFKVSYISNYLDDQNDIKGAIEKLREIGLTTASFNKFKRSVEVMKIKTNSKLMKSDVDVIHFYNYVLDSFKTGLVISTNDLVKAANHIKKLSFGDDTKPYTKTKAVKIISTFVSLKKTHRTDTDTGKRIWMYEVENQNPSGLNINTDVFKANKNKGLNLSKIDLGDFFDFLKL